MHVTLSDGEGWVAKDLLDAPDVHPLLQHERGRSLPGIVRTGLADARFPCESLPLLPAVAGWYRPTVGVGNDGQSPPEGKGALRSGARA